MSEILYGEPVALEIEEKNMKRVSQFVKCFGYAPTLAMLVNIDDDASMAYARVNERICEKWGLNHRVLEVRDEDNTREVLQLIDILNEDERVHGIVLQTPMHEAIDERTCMQRVLASKDVDGLSYLNFGCTSLEEDGFKVATALAIVRILKYYDISVAGKNAVVVGRSAMLGKPLAMMLLNEDATVTICHSKTENLASHLQMADLVLCCAGVAGLVKESDLKRGAVVIDAGYDDRLGDYEHQDLGITSAYTPVPKGVGVVTSACLAEQTIDAAFRLELKKRGVKIF